ncbi:hypothetical protein INT44_000120 [Umbelopsis vinacea]|uniref:Ubiquitin-like modifier HUB1 n=1 Tax=Umbelopsis vinacea TaxID=44442 RepID=A0A8H7U7F7_9FUNG|nr:hypothetical protein INT44_000120 [Umbelopsis vinacea]
MLRFKKHDKESSPSEDKEDRRSGRDYDSSRHSRHRSRSASPRRRRSRERRPRSRSNERRRRRSRSRSPGVRRTSRRDDKYVLVVQPRESRSEKKPTPSSSAADGSKPKVPVQAQTLKATGRMVEIQCNDRLGKKIRVKASPRDTIGDFKKLVAAQIGTEARKIVLKKWYKEFKDHITLDDCE